MMRLKPGAYLGMTLGSSSLALAWSAGSEPAARRSWRRMKCVRMKRPSRLPKLSGPPDHSPIRNGISICQYTDQRCRRHSPGTLAMSHLAESEYSRLSGRKGDFLGANQFGVRCATTTSLATSATCGMICTADAAEPTTTTRFPARSSLWSQTAECTSAPVRSEPRPLTSAGYAGTCSPPTHGIKKRARNSRAAPPRDRSLAATTHSFADSSNRHSVTSWFSRQCSVMRNLRADAAMYRMISSHPENALDQLGFKS